MRRLPLILISALLGMLLSASTALARAGGGTSGFSGGGGGHYSGGGSHYYGSGGSGSAGSAVAVIVIILIVVAFLIFTSVSAWIAKQKLAKRRRERDAQVSRAAAVAAGDDQRFDAEYVKRDVAKLFCAIQEAWELDDRDKLNTMVGRDLMIEWERRLEDFRRRGWKNLVSVVNGPVIEYMNVINREGVKDDRIVVRVEAKMRDVVQTRNGQIMNQEGSTSEFADVAEYWTLAMEGEHAYRLISIEQDAEGVHHLDAEIVASEEDDSRISDQSVIEVAQADATQGIAVAELVSTEYEDDARKAALDLSLVDGRFAPDVLDVAARRVAAGWAEAVDGADDALLAVATPYAVHKLLYGGGNDETNRVVVRGPKIEKLVIAHLEGKADPPTFQVVAHLRGRRYVENRDTAAVISGSKSNEITFSETWTLALDDSDQANPWRLVY